MADGKVDIEKLKTMLGVDVDDARERFGLTWPGKNQAIRTAQTPTTATLEPDKENSVDWDTTQNVFIEGDNLEVLKVLQKHYYGQIKMIYIDPPYNTGNDFVYSDDYRDPIGNYLDVTEQRDGEGKLSTNTESAGRFHSNWLNMMYPRLKLARNLLADDGLIFVSIDENESANLRRIMDEIFGEANYVNTIVWHYGKMSNQKTKLPNNHEYVLVYKRTAGGIFERVKKEESEYRNRYKRFVTAENTVVYGSVKESTDKLIRQRANKIKEELNKSTLDDEDVLFDFNNEFKSHSDVIYVSNIKGNSGENVKVFDTGQKPIDLLDLLLKFGAAEPDSIILDFFAGSGSTAHAVMNLNSADNGKRRFLMVQLPERTPLGSKAHKAGYETISEISRARIRRDGKRIVEGEEAQPDGRADSLDAGFRAYKLVDTNFAKWKADSGLSEDELVALFSDLADSADDHARPEALLTEVLLKLGFSLTEKIETVEVAGLSVFSVSDGLVMAYLDEHTQPTLDQLHALVAEEPERLVVLEDAFQGNDELKTNLVQECRTRNVDLWTA